MIKARRLFLVPSLSMFLLLIPFGFILTIMICLIWYNKKYPEIHQYFKGNNFNKIDDDTKELDRTLI